MSGNNDHLNRLLTEEIQSLEAEAGDLEARRDEITTDLDGVRRRMDLIKALLGTGNPAGAASVGAAGQRAGHLLAAHNSRQKGKGRNVADIAYDILVSRGKKPLYYEDLAEQVVAAGGVLGGETPGQTLVARISRDDRFVRPEKRGWYAAREFYPKAKSVGERKPRGETTRRSRQGGRK